MPHQLSGLAPRIIYDIGANNGDDVPYYLQKADLVVAVEANPILAKGIEERFRNAISNGRLIVENCVLVASPEAQVVDFYIHKTRHILSQFPRPSDGEIGQFDRVSLPGKDVVSLIRAIGEPYYIKIDIENYDHIVLETLFSNNIRPPFISAESHSIEVFALLVSAGRYGAFNLVDGETVPTKYCNHSIRTTSGTATFSFPPHASGPFGEDINHMKPQK